MRSNVLGYPTDRDRWNTMKEILSSLSWMKKNNKNQRYSLAIDMEKDLYKKYLSQYLKAA